MGGGGWEWRSDGETVQAHILSSGISLLLLPMAISVAHVLPCYILGNVGAEPTITYHGVAKWKEAGNFKTLPLSQAEGKLFLNLKQIDYLKNYLAN